MTITVSEFIQERAMFFYKFLRSPAQIGSVTPSSKFLARAMVQSICWDKVNSVAEPGAGTGAITKYIQAAANADTRVLLFEKDPALYRELRFQYAQYGCYRDACRLQYIMAQEQLEGAARILLLEYSDGPYSQPSREDRSQPEKSSIY